MFSKLFTYAICFLTCFCAQREVQAFSPIQAVIFDFGKVIATQDKTEVTDFLIQALEMSGDDEWLRYAMRLKVYLSLGGTEKDFWEEIAQERGIQLSSDWFEEYEELQRRSIREIPHMLEIVDQLKRQGYRTPLLSNTGPTKAALWKKFGYYDHFSPLLLSYALGCEKPEPEIYEILLYVLDLPPSACLFIDDKIANIVAARQRGMDGILFSNASQLIEELARRGIKVKLPSQ